MKNPAWVDSVLDKNMAQGSQQEDHFTFDEYGILRSDVGKSESDEFHKKHSKGAFLRKLKDVKHHQVNWETPYYFKVFDRFLDKESLIGKTCTDFGCGDGRFTQYLLEKGANQIVCVDIDYKVLVELSQYVQQNGYSDKVLLIHTDLENMPIKENSIDLVVAIRSLYYTNTQYESGIAKVNRLLKRNGLLICSDPNLEGFVVSALFFESLSEGLATLETRRFNEVKEKNDLRFRTFTESELINIFTNSNFEILDRHGISMIHKIMRILLVRGNITESEIDENWNKVQHLFDFMHEEGKLFKDIVWKLRKQNG